MKGIVTIIFCVFLCVFGDDQPSVTENLSQETKETLDNVLDFMACVDEGKCDPLQDTNPDARKPAEPVVPGFRQNTPTEHVPISRADPNYPIVSGHIHIDDIPREHFPESGEEPIYPIDPEVRSPYYSLCEKFHMRLSKLESQHEELKSLKFEFLDRLNYYASGISLDCSKGESIVIKILDLIVFVAENMKRDFGFLTHEDKIPVEEIIAEENYYHDDEPRFVGSYRSIPGVHYPNYTEVPITSFSCSGRRVPGFYVDLETRCQVFHVCYEHRMESFLCPLGTIFNQALLVCDYWYSSTCSSDTVQVDLDNDHNEAISVENTHTISEETGSSIDTFVGQSEENSEEELKKIVKFLPVKAKIVEFPKGTKAKAIVSSIDDVKEVANKIFGGILTTGTDVASKTLEAIEHLSKSKVSQKGGKLTEPQVDLEVLPRDSKFKQVVSSIDGVEEVANKIFGEIVTTSTKVASKTRQALEVLPKPQVLPKFVKLPEPQIVPILPKVVPVLPKVVKLPKPKVVPVLPKVIPILPKVVKLPEPKIVPVLPKVVPVLPKVVKPIKPQVVQPFPKPIKIQGFPKLKPLPLKVKSLLKSKIVPWSNLKMAVAGALPVSKTNMAASVPLAKAKVASAKIPLLKAKFITAAAPVAKANLVKASVPLYKVKAIPAAVAKPVAKTKLVKSKLAATVPVIKVKKVVKSVPIYKAAAVRSKLVAPLVKTKLVKSAVISPLTTKALALGYLKLLKAKKLALAL